MQREVFANIINKIIMILFLFVQFFVCRVNADPAQEIEWDIVKDYFAANPTRPLVYIHKTAFRIYVITKEHKIVFEAPISVGKNEDLKAKMYQQDQRTPEGMYKIIEVMRSDFPSESPEYKKIKTMNTAYFSAKEGHYRFEDKKKDLGTNSFGFGFFRLNYPNENDRRRYLNALQKGLIPKNAKGDYKGFGAGIGIHGTNDPDSMGHPMTTGCIRLRNEELKALAEYLDLGQRVYIAH